MDWLRRVLSSIGEQLGKLTPTARLLIGAVAVILVMGLFLASLWASSPDREEIYPGADASVKRQAIVRLTAAGLDASIDPAGRLVVPRGQADLARGVLAEDGVLPSDGQVLFGNLSTHMKWTNPREINQQMVQMALQGELERTIANFPSMRSARVFLDVPEPVGIGLAARRPTASVSVMTADGGAVKQTQVDAVARLVARAVSGLDVQQVSVVDASTGRHLQPTPDEDVLATTYLEHQRKVEQDFERKVRGLLAHIPGVGVAVTAEVDVKRVTSRREAFLNDREGSVAIEIESSLNTEEQRLADRGAEPGVRPNTGADINQGPSDEAGFVAEDSTARSEARFGSEVTSTVDPRGMPTAVSVSVQVPRGYIAGLITGGSGAEGEGEAEPPDEAAIESRFEQERSRIAAIIEPHLPRLLEGDGSSPMRRGEVAVGLMSVDPPMLLASAGGGSMGGLGFLTSGSSGGAFGLGVPLLEQGLLVLLAGVAVVMMLLMVRKATRRTELPSAQELVGIPPALEGLGDVVGEASESESPLEGIELASEDVQAANLLGEVQSLVTERPDLAAKLLSRWVDAEP
ncbi:MAG: hypothetical protein ACTS22_01160 [Phycisphaerales bacterium]